MARFRLLQPHWLERGLQRIATYLETGTEIDTAEMPAHFRPSPLMAPLDQEAGAMLAEVIADIRERAGTASPPVVGPLHNFPGGDVYEANRRREGDKRSAENS
jgi:hypothetical protein